MDVLDVLLVSIENAIDTLDLRIIKVAVQREAMTRLLLSHETRYATETEAREVLIVVVLLENSSDLRYGIGVVIVSSSCMKRAAISDLSVRSREVNCY